LVGKGREAVLIKKYLKVVSFYVAGFITNVIVFDALTKKTGQPLSLPLLPAGRYFYGFSVNVCLQRYEKCLFKY
jgi:hypothetical protein